ncbi:Mo25-like, putative [Angomonas deanei]|uniref:Mo25-like, putative n=1 Tax=Angomonas deanei TaxID=59799 RepID=A0A7G2C8F8_9TRYP|nr:Mo25-like, putative [Angomonas deanei]
MSSVESDPVDGDLLLRERSPSPGPSPCSALVAILEREDPFEVKAAVKGLYVGLVQSIQANSEFATRCDTEEFILFPEKTNETTTMNEEKEAPDYCLCAKGIHLLLRLLSSKSSRVHDGNTHQVWLDVCKVTLFIFSALERSGMGDILADVLLHGEPEDGSEEDRDVCRLSFQCGCLPLDEVAPFHTLAMKQMGERALENASNTDSNLLSPLSATESIPENMNRHFMEQLGLSLFRETLTILTLDIVDRECYGFFPSKMVNLFAKIPQFHEVLLTYPVHQANVVAPMSFCTTFPGCLTAGCASSDVLVAAEAWRTVHTLLLTNPCFSVEFIKYYAGDIIVYLKDSILSASYIAKYNALTLLVRLSGDVSLKSSRFVLLNSPALLCALMEATNDPSVPIQLLVFKALQSVMMYSQKVVPVVRLLYLNKEALTRFIDYIMSVLSRGNYSETHDFEKNVLVSVLNIMPEV